MKARVGNDGVEDVDWSIEWAIEITILWNKTIYQAWGRIHCKERSRGCGWESWNPSLDQIVPQEEFSDHDSHFSTRKRVYDANCGGLRWWVWQVRRRNQVTEIDLRWSTHYVHGCRVDLENSGRGEGQKCKVWRKSEKGERRTRRSQIAQIDWLYGLLWEGAGRPVCTLWENSLTAVIE